MDALLAFPATGDMIALGGLALLALLLVGLVALCDRLSKRG
jgi:hypothetical protein